MPNHCINTLIVSGKSDEIDKFYNENLLIENNEIIPNTLSFDRKVPLESTNCGKIEEAEKKWGTAWDVGRDVDCIYIKQDKIKLNEIHYDFSTAWSPPTTWLSKTHDFYPSLNFHLSYYEIGEGFRGFVSFGNNPGKEHRDMTASDYVELGYENDDDSIDYDMIESVENYASG